MPPRPIWALEMLKGTTSTARIMAIEALITSIAMWPNETAQSRRRFICVFLAGEVNRFTRLRALRDWWCHFISILVGNQSGTGDGERGFGGI